MTRHDQAAYDFDPLPGKCLIGFRAIHSCSIDALAKNRADVDDGRRASR